MQNELFKKFDYYWIFFILTVILCYGFFLTHPVMGIDDENFIYWHRFGKHLELNRIAHWFSAKIFNNFEFIPFHRDFLMIIIFMFGITLHNYNFMKYLSPLYDKKMATMFACITISFPFIAFYSCFSITVIESSIVLLLSAIAIKFIFEYFEEKKNIKFWYSVTLISIIISFYEIGILYFLMPILFIYLFKMINGKCIKNLSLKCFYSFTACILGTFLYYVIIEICRCMMGMIYRRYSQYNMYDFSSIEIFWGTMKTNFVFFFNKFLQSCLNSTGSKIILASSIIFTILIFYFSLKKNKYILIYGLLLFVLNFLPFLLTGNYNIQYRVFSPFCFFISITFILLYQLLRERKIPNLIFPIFCFFIVFYQSQEINKIFYTEYLKFQDDRLFAYSINLELNRRGINKPVLFIGTRENTKLRQDYNIEAPEINISIFNWDRYLDVYFELFSFRPYKFMSEQGYPVRNFSEEHKFLDKDDCDAFILKVKKLSKDMEMYPKGGFIKDCGDFVLIKIGKSKLD